MVEVRSRRVASEILDYFCFLIQICSVYKHVKCAVLCVYHTSNLNKKEAKVKKILFAHLILLHFEITIAISLL